MLITQHPLARALNWSLTVIGAAGALFVTIAPIPVAARLTAGAASIALGVLLSWRSTHMSIEVRDGVLTIRGWWLPRTIPVRQVTGLTRFPAITWTDEFGRHHWSPLWMLVEGRQRGPIVQHNRAELQRLSRKLHKKPF